MPYESRLRNRPLVAVCGLGARSIMLHAARAHAVPVFARTYGTSCQTCQTCHTAGRYTLAVWNAHLSGKLRPVTVTAEKTQHVSISLARR